MITRGFRRTRQQAPDTAESRHAARFVRYSWDDDGNLVGAFKLPAEEGAALVAAIEASTSRDRVREADADGARDGFGAARADTLVELVRAGAQREPGDGGDGGFLVTLVVDASTMGHGSGTSSGGTAECRVQDGP